MVTKISNILYEGTNIPIFERDMNKNRLKAVK